MREALDKFAPRRPLRTIRREELRREALAGLASALLWSASIGVVCFVAFYSVPIQREQESQALDSIDFSEDIERVRRTVEAANERLDAIREKQFADRVRLEIEIEEFKRTRQRDRQRLQ
jgi:hypothetical protein